MYIGYHRLDISTTIVENYVLFYKNSHVKEIITLYTVEASSKLFDESRNVNTVPNILRS